MTTADEPKASPGRHASRADALRNREAILKAASTVLAEQGTAVDVREIARRSGVGMGTLYRHFPKKEVLVQAVLRTDFLTWAASARRAAAGAEDPWMALTDFYKQALTGYARHRAMMEHFALTWTIPDMEGIEQLRSVIEELCAHAAHLMRDGVTADDLLLLLVSLGHAVEITRECQPEMWTRLLHISLDGLRTDLPEPLPSAAPSTFPSHHLSSNSPDPTRSRCL